MQREKFNTELLNRIISLHDECLGEIPKSHLDLYVSEDAVMWDGYIASIVELNEAIDSAFRLNPNVESVSVSEAFMPDGIEKLSLSQVGFLFRDILVNEKFHQALFVDVIMDGRVTRLVNRLKSILNT